MDQGVEVVLNAPKIRAIDVNAAGFREIQKQFARALARFSLFSFLVIGYWLVGRCSSIARVLLVLCFSFATFFASLNALVVLGLGG